MWFEFYVIVMFSEVRDRRPASTSSLQLFNRVNWNYKRWNHQIGEEILSVKTPEHEYNSIEKPTCRRLYLHQIDGTNVYYSWNLEYLTVGWCRLYWNSRRLFRFTNGHWHLQHCSLQIPKHITITQRGRHHWHVKGAQYKAVPSLPAQRFVWDIDSICSLLSR